MRRARLISRIAIFSALVYLLSWATASLPNVSLIFFIVFTAGLVWGGVAGLAVGLIGMGLWTSLNPYGPAMPPIMVVQCLGAAMSGLIGAAFGRLKWQKLSSPILLFWLSGAAVACTVAYYLPVSLADAWVFQPFWPRFVTGMIWSLWSLVSNVAIFTLLFGVTRRLYSKEVVNR